MSSQQGKMLASSSNYMRILVGFDGSKNSKRALARAATLAKEHGSLLKIVVVVNSNSIALAPMAPPIPPEVFEDLMNNGRRVLSEAMVAAGDLVPEVTGNIEEGNPADCILRVAAKDSVDLVVVGRRGISGIERFLLGGVSSSVVAHSKCDVLVVR